MINELTKRKKTTEELEKILGDTHPEQFEKYLDENKDSMLEEDRPFYHYMKELIGQKGLKLQDVFLYADVPERYGYKLISQEKRTRQRDVLLRIFYAANMTLEEVQRALKLYQMPGLYAKDSRDALLMIAFNEHTGNTNDVNELLVSNGMEPLKGSGFVE